MYTNDSKEENLTLNWMDELIFVEIEFTMLSWINGSTLLMLGASILVGNAFVILVVALVPLKNIRRCPSNHLVLSLAVADFSIGASICFFRGCWNIHYAVHQEDLFNMSQQNIGAGKFELVAISTTNLLALCIDRLIAIKVPLRYSYTVTKRRVTIVITFTWLYFIGLSTVLTFYLPEGTIRRDFIFNCHGLVAFVGLVINCGIVIHPLRKQSNAMKHLCGSSNTLRNIVEREKKVTGGTVIITAVFIACFLPFFIYQLLDIFCFICWTSYSDVSIVFGTVALLLVVINSMVNPYIYAYRLPKYLHAFKYLGKKLLCRKLIVNPREDQKRPQVDVRIYTAVCRKITRNKTKL